MIKDILILQKKEFENRMKELYVSRAVSPKKLDNPMIKVVIGPRRSGKSFFSLHFLKDKKFGYANFDDERLIDLDDYDELIVAINSVYDNPKFLLFDEIQNLDKWELFANRLHRQGYNLMITGSNSKLLSRELATHLTGRHFLINMFPFSFREYLKLGKGDLTTSEIKGKLAKYLVSGGYPEPEIKNIDNREYLRTLFDSVIYKDIVKRHKIRQANKIEDLAFYLLSNIANEYSYNSLMKLTKIDSVHTIEKYLDYLEESFIFFSVKRFSYKVKEQLSSIKKIYCTDNGMITSRAFQASPDFGRLYENLVAIELKKREMDNLIDVFYWKNQQQEEVDFVVKKELKIVELIQVCYDMNPKVKEREVRALVKAGKELKCKKLTVITKDYEGREKVDWFGIKAEVEFVALWRWL
ncbi:MAG: ATP-binding protein [Nanoarchaeota archaeon]|nr:ATP-binding protein [Nanoarchaeota archaeon]